MPANVIDSTLYYSNAQVLTADGYSTNSINHKAPAALPYGAKLAYKVTGLNTGEQLTIHIEDDADGNFGSGNVRLLSLPSITVSMTDLKYVPLSPEIVNLQHTKLYYDGTFLTGGNITVTAFLTLS